MVGAGRMANTAHYPSLAAMPDVEIVGIAELNAERLQATADKYDVSGRYSDFRQLVAREKPDAVYAIMPPQHLHNLVVDLLELGVHVFVEKPPAITTYQNRGARLVRRSPRSAHHGRLQPSLHRDAAPLPRGDHRARAAAPVPRRVSQVRGQARRLWLWPRRRIAPHDRHRPRRRHHALDGRR